MTTSETSPPPSSRRNVLDSSVIGGGMQRHRHQEFIRFLNAVETEVPAEKLIHAIVDNYAAHKHPKVVLWLARHPRWTFHSTPTSASWRNAVEGFFAKLAKRRLKRERVPLARLSAGCHQPLRAGRQHRAAPFPMDQGPR